MKHRLTLLSLLVILSLSACNETQEDKKNLTTGTDNSNTGFVLKTSDKTINSAIAFYNRSDERTSITAISENNQIITVTLFSNPANVYKFNENCNLSLNDQEEFYNSKSGELKITTGENGLISGEFSALLISSSDTTIKMQTYGTFENISAENTSLPEKTVFESSKNMFVNTETGELKNETIESIIVFSEKKLTIEYPGNGDKNMEMNIVKLDKNGSSIILHTDNNEIDKVLADLKVDNQITIWYKNGNTITYFK